jgi:hypothetical protein
MNQCSQWRPLVPSRTPKPCSIPLSLLPYYVLSLAPIVPASCTSIAYAAVLQRVARLHGVWHLHLAFGKLRGHRLRHS